MSNIRLDFTPQASDAGLMNKITPSVIRYIKLGAGGAWEGALDHGRLEWGTAIDRLPLKSAGDWEAVGKAYAAAGLIKSTATGYTNEARAFHDADPKALWITFARGRMWWTFADAEVHHTPEGEHAGAYHREALGGWHDQDVDGERLTLDRLTTRLTRLAAYRRTICHLSAEQEQLCLRYINAERDVDQLAAENARADLRRHLTKLIQRLSWDDFEQLVDLALGRSGWVRVSALGGTAKDVDLIVEQPFTRERMTVQVKSSADQQVINDYAKRLGAMAGERSLLICHSPAGFIQAPPNLNGHKLELMVGEAITDLSIGAGLIDWVLQRAR